ncbi:MAG: polysaccharide deacetylase family protein [Oscillospiraceae bacterium]|nr:polysaccharide deacetylase family protein [Oscillospiraceae bacterium]
MRSSIIKKTLSVLLCGGFIFTSGCSAENGDGKVTTQTETTTAAVSETTADTRVYDKICALTFDDGPNTDTTPLVLDKLEKHGVTASFFLVGNNINDTTAEVVKRAYDMGCEIHNHSKTHSAMPDMDKNDIIAEIDFTNKKIEEITGTAPAFFRPPYIAVNNAMFECIDLPFISGYGANDWEATVLADERAEKIITQAKDGAIFLLHDMSGNIMTVEALDTIIPTLKDQGYEFVTMTELFRRKGIEPQDGIVYSYAEQTTMY